MAHGLERTVELRSLPGEKELAERLQVGSTTTENIDLTSIFGEDPIISGSFDVESINRNSFCNVLRAIPIPALLVDKSRSIIFCNDACARISKNYMKLQGMTFSSVFPGLEGTHVGNALIEDILESGKGRVSELELSFDRSIWARVYFRPFWSAEQRYVLTPGRPDP